MSVLGENITYIGKSGSGQITKACNQILVAGTMVAVSEILLIAKKTGCNLNLVKKALMGGFANSKILDLHGYYVHEAWEEFKKFIDDSKDMKYVTVITGKGKMQEEFQHWVDSDKRVLVGADEEP